LEEETREAKPWKPQRTQENQRSIRVAERLGESLRGRIDHHGREMLCYGIDRDRYLGS
jgi:RimJ/RimL family protein N-acetyltransferase